MTITLDIKPETEAELVRQAAACGVEVSDYAAALLEEALPVALIKANASSEPKNMVELFAPLRGLNLDFERDRDQGRDIVL